MLLSANSVELGQLSSSFERTLADPSIFDTEKLPENFPKEQWERQSSRYSELWSWYSGDKLAVTRQNKDGDSESQFPLHINSLRAFVRKHAAVLFGEVADGAAPLVKTVIRPRKRFDGQKVKEEDKRLAEMLETIVNEVWSRSGGRAKMLENGKYSQFLGGSIFECGYEPSRTDLLVPLVIRNPRTDYFLPEWSNEDHWTLLRGSTVFQIPETVAKMQYGISDGRAGEYVIFYRSWTKDKYSVKVDGQPLQLKNGKAQDNLDNPFGITPSIYIPHVLEGSNYGPTHVEDVAALLKEYNGRIADLGDAVLQTTNRQTWGSNIYGEIKKLTTPDGTVVNNLGITPAASGSKEAPKVWEGTPPPVSQYMVDYANMIWRQMLRDADLSGIPFGEDEGSQRSGQTLALRMWPILSHTREERTHWNDGLTKMAYIIIKMVAVIAALDAFKAKFKAIGIEIPSDWEQRVEISTEWAPQIPQDRTALVAETRDLHQTGLRSVHEGLVKLGDVKDIEEEEERIKQDQQFAADLASQQNQPFGGGSSSSSNGTSSNGATAHASSPKLTAN